MVVTLLAGDLATGRVLGQVPASAATWSAALNGAGTIDATVSLRNLPDPQRAPLVSRLAVGSCFLAAVTGQHILEAGPIWGHRFDDKSGTLRVTASGLWSYFDHRKAIPPAPWPSGRVQNAVLSWDGFTLGTIAKKLVSTAMQHDGGTLPIAMPTDIAGTSDRTYNGWELADVGDTLRELVDDEDGPDIAFDPRFMLDGTVQWVMRAGTDTDPLLHQSGPDWQWDRGAPKGGLSSLSVDVDGSGLATRAWMVGTGSERDQLLGMAEETQVGMPLLEASEARTTVKRQATINRHARSLLGTSRRPWHTWTATARADRPTLGTYRPGDWAGVSVPTGHEYLKPGTHRTRIVEIGGDLGDDIAIKFAPTMEAR